RPIWSKATSQAPRPSCRRSGRSVEPSARHMNTLRSPSPTQAISDASGQAACGSGSRSTAVDRGKYGAKADAVSESGAGQSRPSRRRLIRIAAGLAAAAGAGLGTHGGAKALDEIECKPTAADGSGLIEPFWGTHQGGITTPAQRHTYAAAFDLVALTRDQV